MIIEFLGVSGVGKTTLSKKYYNKHIENGEKIIWYTYKLYSECNWFSRNLYKGIKIFLYVISNFGWVFRFKKILNKAKIHGKELLKLLFNGVYLKLLIAQCKHERTVYLFDEGITQLVWSILLRTDAEINNDMINEIGYLFGFPDKIIVVLASPKTIKERILKRGEYTKIMDSLNLYDAIEKMQEKVCEISKIMENKEKINVEYIDNNVIK